MIYLIDGNFVSIDGNLLERKVKSMTFQTKGRFFPYDYNNTDLLSNTLKSNISILTFESDQPNTITINYGDGNVVSAPFVYTSPVVKFQIKLGTTAYDNRTLNQHQFTDGNDGSRNITVSFEFPQFITTVRGGFVVLEGQLPSELEFFPKLKEIRFTALVSNINAGLTGVPDKFPPELKNYVISTALASKLNKLPDTLFETDLETLSISSSYNCSDLIASNFFKIGQLKTTLKTLIAANCDLTEVDDSLRDCVLLETLDLQDNNFLEFSSKITSLTELKTLTFGKQNSPQMNFVDFTNNNKITTLFLKGNYNLSEIPTKWVGLTSLNNMAGVYFGLWIVNTAQFNDFINNFYTLCTSNGSIVANGSTAPYTNRFRNISWGVGTRSFNGAKVAPPGYIQGVSNGFPITQGQRVFVLQNQMNHTITHGTPII